MHLSIPPEPLLLKPSLQPGFKTKWDNDSLGLWFGNQLPRYLWNDGGWAAPLKKEGYTWQSFLKALSLHKKDMIQWARDSLAWKDFLHNLQETFTDPVLKTVIQE